MARIATMADAEAFLEKRVASQRTPFDLTSILFGPQLAFVQDPAPFADAVCSRRAGKSVGIGAWLAEGPLLKPKAPSLYLTQTRGSAKRIIWSTLLDLNRRYRLGYEPNEAELILKRGGVGMVYLAGLDNKSEIEKARGTGWGRVAIDEAQSLPQFVKELVEDVLMPSLMDHDGQIRMIGTPAPVPTGYFHGVSQSPAWKHHGWTVWDNPHVPNAKAKLAQVLKARGLNETDPSIQREWWGRWVLDLNSLVFRFDATRNGYGALPKFRKPWGHVIGVDLGFDDSDAIAITGFNEQTPAAYLVEEDVAPKQTITQLAEKLARMVKRYEPLAIVVDTGGLGKKIAEEITARTGLPLKAAEKTRKFEYIELLNDAMRSGRFFARPDSRFAQDAMLVEWDKEKSTNEKREISDRFHSDICDAVLYSFRESLHWLHRPAPPPPPKAGSAEWAEEQEDDMEAASLAQNRAHTQGEWDKAW